MTYGQLFMRMNPNVKVVENGTCVWIFFDEVNHDTMRKGWWDKEIPDDANDAGWISVKDRLPDMLEPFWAACKSLTDYRDNWTIEGIYKGTTFGGPWGVPIVEMGKAEVYAWKPKEIPEPPKEET